jgi:hypothetical protein
MTTTQPSAAETNQLPIGKQLNQVGADHSIPRKDGESDADYAERLVYELNVCVEELWACQDRIRDLVPINE